MTTVKISNADIRTLSASDRTALCMIYTHRCLTAAQLFHYYYEPDGHRESYAKKHLDKMFELAYLQSVDYGKEEPAIFLTSVGIEIVKKLFCLKTTRTYGVNPETADLHWKAADLMMEPLKINHQITLNEFVLDFDSRAAKYHMDYSYRDEKFVPAKDITSARARPDGCIDLPNVTIYLETDMNTESQTALNRKWNCYRVFFNTKEQWELLQKKPVVILFILENVTYPEIRRTTVLKSVRAHFMDCISDRLDMYIDTRPALMSILFDKVIQQIFDTSIFTAKESLEKSNYYLRKSHITDNTDLPKYSFFGENETTGKALFLDSYQYAPLSVLKKITTSSTNAMLARKQLGRQILYVVTMADDFRLKNDLRVIGGFCYENVIFYVEKIKTGVFVQYNAFFTNHEIAL